MGSGLGKNKNHMKPYLRTKKEDEAYLWGIRHGVKISPFAASKTDWWIDIEVKDQKNRSPKTYDGKTVWPKVFELYQFYYDKYNKKL